MVPQMAMMGIVNYFFSGFVLGKIPFPLTPSFKGMLQRGISLIPKSRSPARLAQNLDLEGFVLSEEEMATMASLDQHRRFNDPGEFCLGMGAFCPIYD